MVERFSSIGEIPQPVVVDRRAPTIKECNKMDTFENIGKTLMRLEDKMDDMSRTLHERIDKLSDGMSKMITLEQQLLGQSRDINELEKTIKDLQEKKNALELRIISLQHQFDSHDRQVNKYERAGWVLLTGVGSIIGAYMMKQMGLG